MKASSFSSAARECQCISRPIRRMHALSSVSATLRQPVTRNRARELTGTLVVSPSSLTQYLLRHFLKVGDHNHGSKWRHLLACIPLPSLIGRQYFWPSLGHGRWIYWAQVVLRLELVERIGRVKWIEHFAARCQLVFQTERNTLTSHLCQRSQG